MEPAPALSQLAYTGLPRLWSAKPRKLYSPLQQIKTHPGETGCRSCVPSSMIGLRQVSHTLGCQTMDAVPHLPWLACTSSSSSSIHGQPSPCKSIEAEPPLPLLARKLWLSSMASHPRTRQLGVAGWGSCSSSFPRGSAMFWGVRLESYAPLFHDWPIHREPVYGSCTSSPYTIGLWRVRQTHRSKVGEVEPPLLQLNWGASPWELPNPLPRSASGGLEKPMGTRWEKL